MPITHLIDPRLRLAAMRLSGRVTGSDLIQAHHALANDPGWRQGFYRLWDARDTGELLLEHEIVTEYLALIEHLGERMKATRVAYLTKRALEDAVATMFAALAQRGPTKEHRLFRRIDDAARWLEIPAADLVAFLKTLRAQPSL